ncbi:MAG: twin-arginine translocase subunit TatC [Bacteroidetes bacterium]|nr:MAG: twin-arginine translocase subunit TatC [Bacteroidota bacterium]
MDDQKEMSFLDHLEELRWRLVRSAVAIILFATVIWVFQEWIMDHVFLSMKNPSFFTFQFFCDNFNICVEEIPVKMQSTTVAGQFSYALMMSVMGGIVVSFPFIFWQIWSFVKPGLKQNEKSVAKGVVLYVSLLFFLGITFGYFVVAPLCVQFFGSYQISTSVENIFTINSYMSTIISTVFYSGLLFLLPVVSYIFSKLGIITAAFLRKYRKHSIIGVLVLSAIITPPDLVSQVIVAIPIVLLYEISIFVVALVERKALRQT